MPSRSPSSSPFARGRTAPKQGVCCLRSSPCKGEDRWGSVMFLPAQTSGLAETIRVSPSWLKEPGAAGAVALRLDFGMATEWSVTARRAGQEFRRTPRKGPRSRVFVTGAARTNPPCFSHLRFIRGGLTPVRPDEADSQPSFLGSPWPDLPGAVRDRTPPARPILSPPPQPERHLIRLL